MPTWWPACHDGTGWTQWWLIGADGVTLLVAHPYGAVWHYPGETTDER